MNADTIVGQLGEVESRREGPDGLWLAIPNLNARRMAEVMRDSGIARFCTITGVEDDAGIRLVYHWDVGNTLVNVSTPVRYGAASTLTDIWPAADWIEREIRDYYGIEFTGRAETPPLMLREGDEPGLFSRTHAISRDADPADTGWSENLTATSTNDAAPSPAATPTVEEADR
jgi:NADH:ubiquinone oxidoreductase subunit C